MRDQRARSPSAPASRRAHGEPARRFEAVRLDLGHCLPCRRAISPGCGVSTISPPAFAALLTFEEVVIRRQDVQRIRVDHRRHLRFAQQPRQKLRRLRRSVPCPAQWPARSFLWSVPQDARASRCFAAMWPVVVAASGHVINSGATAATWRNSAQGPPQSPGRRPRASPPATSWPAHPPCRPHAAHHQHVAKFSLIRIGRRAGLVTACDVPAQFRLSVRNDCRLRRADRRDHDRLIPAPRQLRRRRAPASAR